LRCFEEPESTFYCASPTENQARNIIPQVKYSTLQLCNYQKDCNLECNEGFTGVELGAVCSEGVWRISGRCVPPNCAAPTAHKARTLVPNINYTTVQICDKDSECELLDCNFGFTAVGLNAVCSESVWVISGSCTPNVCEAPTQNELVERIPNIDYTEVRSCHKKTECQPNCNPGFYDDDLKAVCIGPVWDISGRCLDNVCFAPTKDEAEKQVPHVNYKTVYSCDGESNCELSCIWGYTAEDLKATCKENSGVWSISGKCAVWFIYMISFGAVLLGSCCCCLFCFFLYRAYKASSSIPLTHVIAKPDIEARSVVAESDAKEIYHSTEPTPEGYERKENVYVINVGSDIKQLGLTFTNGVVSECMPGGYADTCNVSIGHTLISANNIDVTEFSISATLKVLQSRPLKLVFSKPPKMGHF